MMQGGCLCGKVRYEAKSPPQFAFNCYCTTCRKETGAGHATVAAFPSDQFEVKGTVREFVAPRENDAPPIPRYFCPDCGTTLFARPVQKPGMTMVRAGTLDAPAPLKIDGSAFGEQAADWDRPAEMREGR